MPTSSVWSMEAVWVWAMLSVSSLVADLPPGCALSGYPIDNAVLSLFPLLLMYVFAGVGPWSGL